MPKLTKSAVDRAQVASADLFLWDSTLPGFGLRVKPSGVKSFLLQYRTQERLSRRMTIGRYGPLTLDEARREAKRLLGKISLGRDPAREKAETGTGPTVADLARQYMTQHCAGRCKPSTLVQHQWLLDKFVLPEIGSRKVKALARHDVEHLHQKLASTPYNANRVLGLLKAMFNHAEHWGWRPPGSNPTRLVKKFRESKKQRYLSPDELCELWDAIAEAEKSARLAAPAATAFRLLILTGCRVSEILTLRWSAVDLNRRILLLSKHKGDAHGPKVVPLNRRAIAILSTIRRVEGNPYVIIGKNEDCHLVNLQKPWRMVRAMAGLEDVRIHDLRHTFASLSAGLGISLPLIGGLLGHSDQQSSARYAHLSQESLRVASDQVGQRFEALMKEFEPSTQDGAGD